MKMMMTLIAYSIVGSAAGYCGVTMLIAVINAAFDMPRPFWPYWTGACILSFIGTIVVLKLKNRKKKELQGD